METSEKVALAFGLPNLGSMRDVVRAATGWDVLAPPPNEVVWTLELSAKCLFLRDLHAITAGCSGASRKNHDALVADIVTHHPQCKQQAVQPQ